MQLIVNNDEMLGRTTDKTLHLALIEKDKEIERLNNVINELEKWFKSYHKYQNRLKWNEQDYIDFIDNLEKELKEGK